jgi:hypothetical protein
VAIYGSRPVLVKLDAVRVLRVTNPSPHQRTCPASR